MSDVATKWGPAVAERGFAQVPNYLLLLNQFLSEEARLKPAELLLLIQLVGSWWHKDQLPFPSVRTLALRCGVSERQVQRGLMRLETLGFVKRVSRRSHGGIIQSNSYDLSPAASILAKIAETFPNAFPRKPRKLTATEQAFFSTIKVPEISSVDADTESRIEKALAEHGSAAYTTAAGAVLDLMTNLTEENNLAGFSRAVVLLDREKPASAATVLEAVPAKISNFLIRRRGVTLQALLQWQHKNPDWVDRLKNSVRDSSRFQQAVEAIAQEIKTTEVNLGEPRFT
jgi:hypothetical protein